jgi:hypothetical protein
MAIISMADMKMTSSLCFGFFGVSVVLSPCKYIMLLSLVVALDINVAIV